MRVLVLLRTISAVVLVTTAGCGRRAVTPPVWMPPAECEVLPSPVDVVDSITVALFDAIEPGYAPWAHNAGEQLLFHHLYETLITVDCLGEVRPGLAGSWKREKGGRTWVFKLRGEAFFWDGTPVTASDVARSWQDPMELNPVIDAAAAGDRIVRVHFKHAYREVPRMLSSPAFAVARPSDRSRWPLGSGPYRIVRPEKGTLGLSGQAITARPAFGGDGPVIRFLPTSPDDARDLLEDVIDVMIASDPAVIEYAEGHSQLAVVALPWDRTYVLLSTSRVLEIRRGGTPGAVSLDLTGGLARDAVRGEARGYRSPSWLEDLDVCGDPSAEVPVSSVVPQGAYSASGSRRILYDSKDPVARDLAERIVALAATDPTGSPEAAAIASAVPGLTNTGPGPAAEGVTSRELRSRLRDGDDFAYVVPVPRQPADPCYEARELAGRAPWLAAAQTGFSRTVIPLVDTRRHVIAKRERVGLIVDWYGNILVVGAMLRGR